MVISKKDLKNPTEEKVKYDEVRTAEGTLIDQRYADINNFDNMGLHKTNEEAMKANAEKVEAHKAKPRVIYK